MIAPLTGGPDKQAFIHELEEFIDELKEDEFRSHSRQLALASIDVLSGRLVLEVQLYNHIHVEGPLADEHNAHSHHSQMCKTLERHFGGTGARAIRKAAGEKLDL